MTTDLQHLPTVIQDIAPFVSQYGYFGVGGLLLLENFGIPVPGETVLITAAVFAGLGQLHLPIVIIVAIVFSVLGDNLAFAAGRVGGHPLLERYGKYIFLTPRRVAKMEAFYGRNGARIIVFARFFDGLRQANGLIAGLTNMKWLKFLVYNILGASLWVMTWSLAGYFGASHVAALLHYQLYVTISVVILVTSYFIFKHWKSKRTKTRTT